MAITDTRNELLLIMSFPCYLPHGHDERLTR